MNPHKYGHAVRMRRLFPLLVCGLWCAPAWAQSTPVTIFAPERQQFALALDELEIDAADGARRQAAADLVLPERASIRTADPQRTIVRATAPDTQTLVDVARDIESRNAGARVNLVLYEAGRERSEATRRVLTREVAVLVDGDADAAGLIATITTAQPRQLGAVPGAYIVDAKEPLDAIALAESLGAVPGIKAAYPLLRAQQFPR